MTAGLSAAEQIVNIIPVRDKFPLRIALRKPLAVFLILAAVMAFNVCFILGRSLNISSQKIMYSQTEGHHYQYNTGYEEYKDESLPADSVTVVYTVGAIAENAQLKTVYVDAAAYCFSLPCISMFRTTKGTYPYWIFSGTARRKSAG